MKKKSQNQKHKTLKPHNSIIKTQKFVIAGRKSAYAQRHTETINKTDEIKINNNKE